MGILKAMVEDPPPLAPSPALASARAAYDRFVRMSPAHATEIEDAIIAYGRILWPYRKAFETLVRAEVAAAPSLPSTPCPALIAAHERAHERVRVAVAADDHEYRKLIREFQELQHALEEQIHILRRLAERAADHDAVFAEIMESVRMFERGLAALAREPEVKEVCAAIEAYRERNTYVRDRAVVEARPKLFR